MLNSPLGGRRGIGFGLGRSWQRGGFSPIDIAGCLFWWDFSDSSVMFIDAGSTPVANDGDKIYQMNDKSGNGYNLLQTVETRRPTYKINQQNGLSAGQFIRVSTTVGNTLVNTFNINEPNVTVFVVLKIVDDVYSYVLTLGSNLDAVIYGYAASSFEWYSTSRQVIATLNAGNFQNVNTIVGETYNGSGNYEIACNGTSINGIAGAYYGEVIVYNSELSGDNQTLVNNYISNKWAI